MNILEETIDFEYEDLMETEKILMGVAVLVSMINHLLLSPMRPTFPRTTKTSYILGTNFQTNGAFNLDRVPSIRPSLSLFTLSS